MANKKRRSRAKPRSGTRPRSRPSVGGAHIGARLRWLAALALIGMIGGGYAWWTMRHWQPARAAYAMQGAIIGNSDGDVDFASIKAIGANFVYVEASASAFARDPAVVKNLDGARVAGVQVGALHKYDPCQPADKQAANFVTVVPRDAKMLPPAVELEQLAEDCPVKVTDAAVISELMTFLNQIETHTGKAAILKLGTNFETKYHIAHAIDRNLWLSRDRVEPEYGGRPWAMWTANSGLINTATDQPLRWVVVQQ